MEILSSMVYYSKRPCDSVSQVIHDTPLLMTRVIRLGLRRVFINTQPELLVMLLVDSFWEEGVLIFLQW